MQPKCAMTRSVAVTMMVCAGCMALLAGCAMKTDAPVEQAAGQQTSTPSTTEQGQVTPGSQVYVYQFNGPGYKPADIDSGSPFGSGDAEQPEDDAVDDATGASNGTAKKVKGRFVAAANSIVVTTGNTIPSMTGSTTGTTSGTSQTPTANATANPTQEVKPSISIPVGVAMPGGSNTQQANATGEGSSSGTTQTATTELTTQINRLEAAVDKMGEAIKLLQESWARLFPEPASATQPAE